MGGGGGGEGEGGGRDEAHLTQDLDDCMYLIVTYFRDFRNFSKNREIKTCKHPRKFIFHAFYCTF